MPVCFVTSLQLVDHRKVLEIACSCPCCWSCSLLLMLGRWCEGVKNLSFHAGIQGATGATSCAKMSASGFRPQLDLAPSHCDFENWIGLCSCKPMQGTWLLPALATIRRTLQEAQITSNTTPGNTTHRPTSGGAKPLSTVISALLTRSHGPQQRRDAAAVRRPAISGRTRRRQSSRCQHRMQQGEHRLPHYDYTTATHSNSL